jgi:hypothetical protein
MAEQQTDHDILITLVETNRQQFIIMTGKMDDIKVSMRELKNNTQEDVRKLDVRIAQVEELHNELQLRELAKQVKENSQWINNFKISYRIILIVAAAAGSLITFLLTTALNIGEILKP